MEIKKLQKSRFAEIGRGFDVQSELNYISQGGIV
jgi:hypothetical protein